MKKFIYDMINLTEGQKFIKYWWLWLALLVVIGGIHLILNTQIRKLYKEIRRGEKNETKP